MEKVTLEVHTDDDTALDLVEEWIDELAQEIARRISAADIPATVLAYDDLGWREDY